MIKAHARKVLRRVRHGTEDQCARRRGMAQVAGAESRVGPRGMAGLLAQAQRAGLRRLRGSSRGGDLLRLDRRHQEARRRGSSCLPLLSAPAGQQVVTHQPQARGSAPGRRTDGGGGAGRGRGRAKTGHLGRCQGEAARSHVRSPACGIGRRAPRGRRHRFRVAYRCLVSG